MGAKDRVARWGGCIIAALIVAAAANCALSVFSENGRAEAVEGSARLEVGASIPYGGYETNWMFANGTMAYCGEPAKATPADGDYQMQPVTTKTNSHGETPPVSHVCNVLYYGYGGPGFDRNADYWPRTWYDGSPMTDADYAALTHIIVAQAYSWDGSAALFGVNRAFRTWYESTVAETVVADGAEKNNYESTESYLSWKAGDAPEAFNESCFQIVAGQRTQVILSHVPTGSIELSKASANASITDGNASYSLEGADYRVYDSSGAEVATLITDENGIAKVEGLRAGSYTVKEASAPRGYAAGGETHALTVGAGQTARLALSDVPLTGGGIAVQKLDGCTGEASPEGNATLKGARFTVRYYAGEDQEPLRTWSFETDGSGRIDLAAARPLGGDPLFENAAGEVVWPIGTYTFEETEAPTGYTLPASPTVYRAELSPAGNATSEVVWSASNAQGEGADLESGVLTIPDRVIQGDYRLVKEASISVDNENPNGTSPSASDNSRIIVPGIVFHIVNDSERAVAKPQGGTAGPGEEVCAIVTDENGLASTRNGAANGWSTPSGWAGALAYGTYLIREDVPDSVNVAFREEHGFDVPRVQDWKLNITEDGAYDAPMLVNDKAQTPLKIVKTDAETGERIARTCGFQLFDGQGNQVRYTIHYPNEQVIDTFYANERGEVTLPMLLDPGTYTVHEVAAPEGYVLDAPDAAITVGSEFRGWDDPVAVEMADTPIKGSIHIQKTEAPDDAAPVAHATYDVRAAQDIVTPDGTVRAQAGEVVAHLETNDEGAAETQPLYLGSYVVYETKSPEGYALDTAEHPVTIEQQDQLTPVVTVEQRYSDEPTKLSVAKRETQTDKALPGATFRIWREGTAESDGYDETFETDKDGSITITHLPHGRYRIAETEPPAGYHICAEAYEASFEVNDQGLIGLAGGTFGSTLAIEVHNEPNQIRTTATVNDSHIAEATDRVSLVDTVAYQGTIPGKEYTVAGTLHRASIAEDGTKTDEGAVVDAQGEPVTASTTFVADAVEGTVDVTFDFDASGLTGCTTVVFEEMSQEGALFAAHADIADEEQTVSFKPAAQMVDIEERDPEVAAGPVQTLLAKTGDNAIAVALSLGATASALAVAVAARRLRANQKEGDRPRPPRG